MSLGDRRDLGRWESPVDCIDVAGVYVGRIFVTWDARPQFTVKEICRGGVAEDQDVGGSNRVRDVLHLSLFSVSQE